MKDMMKSAYDKKKNRPVPLAPLALLAVFTGGMLTYLLAVLPFLIDHGGLFFYYGDYNVQQVPFLIFAHRAVRQGRFFWNPLVDLGGNMAGTFSFYLWGSPFFWLTIPFPESWLPYMMPFIMALKYGTASATAYAWIRTRTKTGGAAAIGAFLYAFSGFQACNIVFQHFHDVTAFFPLYLLTFDRFVERRPGGRGRYGFILMTALMSVINYYFFFGQVVFLALYYLVRRGIRLVRGEGILCACREVLGILAGGAAGLMLAAFFLVQSVGGLMGNSRVSEFLSGYDLVAYPDSTTPLAIIRTLFVVPDLIARGTLFSSENIRNGSLAFYLPCFAMAGVIAYWMLRKRSWTRNLLALLAVMAMVPVLNASFSAFNEDFYTRWFYMPVLLCACMTAEVLEEEESTAFVRGTLISNAFTVLFILMCFLPVYEDGTWSFTSVCENRRLLPAQIRATLIGAAVLCVIAFLKHRYGGLFSVRTAAVPAGGPGKAEAAAAGVAAVELPEEEPMPAEAVAAGGTSVELQEEPVQAVATDNGEASAELREEPVPAEAPETGSRLRGLLQPGTLCLALTLVCCIISTSAVVSNGSSLISYSGFEKWKLQMLTQRPVLGENEEPEQEAAAEGIDKNVPSPFSRVETDSTSTNYEMVWGIPTMHCFESTVHPSIFRWYRGIGMIRTVESTLPFERIGARALMSVRYYLENDLVRSDNSYSDQGGIEGYSLNNNENGYNVYETENYIPMGISFDSYMTEENYDLLENGPVSDRVLVKNLILSEEAADRYGDLLTEDTDTDPGTMSYLEFGRLCDERAASACRDFAFDKNGFHATAQLEKDNLVLFSVPWDRGFSATVDGKPAELVRADFGLTAVFVPEGTHEIRFSYLPAGLMPAAVLSLLTALALAADSLHRRRYKSL